MDPGGWRWLVAGLGVGCPGPGRVGPGPDICTAQLVQPPPAAPLHQPHYRLQSDLMVWWRWTHLQSLPETSAMNTVALLMMKDAAKRGTHYALQIREIVGF